jgi:hypothetical protein
MMMQAAETWPSNDTMRTNGRGNAVPDDDAMMNGRGSAVPNNDAMTNPRGSRS